MNLEERKQKVFEALDKLEKEMSILSERIKNARTALSDVTTEEVAKKFVDNNDLEEGLETISLWLN